MLDMIDIDKVRNFFAGDKYATDCTGIVIESCTKGHSVVSLEPDSRHLNAVGGLMGAVYYTLADFAFAVASNWQGEQVVALSCDISYIGAVKGSSLTAEATMLKNGRSVCCYKIEVRDNLGNLAAALQCVGFHKN